MANKNTSKALKTARTLALDGDYKQAIATLQTLVQDSEASCAASASLAELLAFSLDWSGVLQHASAVVMHHEGIATANVLNDMIVLVARAAKETGDWTTANNTAQQAIALLKKANAKPHVEHRLGTIYRRLEQYTRLHGNDSDELINVFGVPESVPNPDAYEKAVTLAKEQQAKKKQTDVEVAQKCFSLAAVFKQYDELTRLFTTYAPHLSFANAVDAARVWASNGELDQAWNAIAPKVKNWFPVDPAQVAPVILITDRELVKLQSKEHWDYILASKKRQA